MEAEGGRASSGDGGAGESVGVAKSCNLDSLALFPSKGP